MKKVITSVHDRCSELWFDPIFAVNEASAMRAFGDAVNNPQSDFYAHPEHYVLRG